MLASQIGVTRDLLQHRVELGRSSGDPLQIVMIEHKDVAIFQSDYGGSNTSTTRIPQLHEKQVRRNQWSA
jgi:hypothetical protein